MVTLSLRHRARHLPTRTKNAADRRARREGVAGRVERHHHQNAVLVMESFRTVSRARRQPWRAARGVGSGGARRARHVAPRGRRRHRRGHYGKRPRASRRWLAASTLRTCGCSSRSARWLACSLTASARGPSCGRENARGRKRVTKNVSDITSSQIIGHAAHAKIRRHSIGNRPGGARTARSRIASRLRRTG